MDWRLRFFRRRRRRRRKTINTAAEAIATIARGTDVDTAIVVFFLSDAASSADEVVCVAAALLPTAVGLFEEAESDTVLGESGEECEEEVAVEVLGIYVSNHSIF